MKQNPYQKFRVKKEVGKCQVLNDDELERFENLTFNKPNTFDEKVKDMFLFGVYTGLRFSDIYRLQKTNFFYSPDGMVMEFQAYKTTKHGKKFLDLLFEGKPRIIANKYMPDDNKIALFKGLTNPKANRLLKILARKANIPNSLCFKDAKDTCATYLMKRFPITLVRDELQHSNIKITNKYTHNDEEETKKAFKRVWNNKQEIT
jgi:integrase